MNFLLHRRLALIDFGAEPEAEAGPTAIAALGAMLPDVWTMADRSARPRRDRRVAADLDRDTRALLDGIDHHVAADAWFHRHPVFVEGEAALSRQFRESPLRARKMGLLGHIGWELCLDGALLDLDGLDPTLTELRETLADTSAATLDGALDAHQPRLADDPSRFTSTSTKIQDLLQRIADGPWIAGYRNGPGLAARLSGVRRRVGLPPIDDQDMPWVVEALERALDRARQAVPELLLQDPSRIP